MKDEDKTKSQLLDELADLRRKITETEETLRQRNRELAWLNEVGEVFVSTLDLDQVLTTVLEEIRRLLDVTACSAWLIDSETDELVCRQVTDPQRQIVRGWRLASGQGLAGWVAQHGQSLNVPDIRADERHFKGVDQQTGLVLRSILGVPLRVKQQVIGVIQVVDRTINRFGSADLILLESLASTAAIAIENARLYEQARQDARTKMTLLHEVNHRVKNNLSAIIGLLYAERRHARVKEDAVFQSLMGDMISRVQGLATAHHLLSASEWRPVLLRDLIEQIIHSASLALPPDKRLSVNVSPSPLRVMPAQANNLALVINELATNTIKYALQGRDVSQITINVTSDDDVVRFAFQDDGPGYPAEVLRLERRNVGLYLIDSIVHNNLRGELMLRNDHGAVAEIQFKLAE